MTQLSTTGPSSPTSDADLIAGLKCGAPDAFETLVKLHGAQMLAVANRFMHCEQDAQDAFQDALICVFRKADQFEKGSKFSTWLHRVTINACLMKLRAERRHEVNIDDLLPAFDETGHHARRPASWEDGPAEHAESAELRRRVRAAIDQLPETYRTVLLLRDIEELDTDETARVLDCSANCVKTRLHRARLALRALLEPMFARSDV